MSSQRRDRRKNPSLPPQLEELESRTAPAVFDVSSVGKPDASKPNPDTLYGAIQLADSNAAASNTIELAAGTYMLKGADSGLVIENDTTIDKTLIIEGNSSKQNVVLNGGNDGQSGLMRINGGANQAVMLKFLTFNGRDVTSSNPNVTAKAGGLSIAGGNVTMSKCQVSGNVVKGAKGTTGATGANGDGGGNGGKGGNAEGGGIYMAGGHLTLKNCTVEDNVAIGGNGGQGGAGGVLRSNYLLGTGSLGNQAGKGGATGAAGAVPGGAGGKGGSGTAGKSGRAPNKNFDGKGGVAGNGGNGGDGGDAKGGGIYIASGQLTVLNNTLIDSNDAEGGAGGAGAPAGILTATLPAYLNPRTQVGFGSPGGTGGFGGNGGFGGLGTVGHPSGGKGGTGGDAGNHGGNGGDGANGGAGGDGGDGGDAFGGGVYLVSGSLQVVSASVNNNQAIGGVGGLGFQGSYAQAGGRGGDGLRGGAGGLGGDGYNPSQNAHQGAPGNGGPGGSGGNGGFGGNGGNNGSGGSGGFGGDGGNAKGGGIYINSATLALFVESTFGENVARGASGNAGGKGGTVPFTNSKPSNPHNSGGKGGSGGAGGKGGAGFSTILGAAASGGTGGNAGNGEAGGKGGNGGNGGNAGNGGNGGNGFGGSIYLATGSITIVDCNFVNSFAKGGNGGAGGAGGNGGPGGTGGAGGNGGNGGGGGDYTLHHHGGLGASGAGGKGGIGGDGGNGGDGGDGGNGGEAGNGGDGEGGDIYVLGASVSVNLTTFSGTATAGNAGVVGTPGAFGAAGKPGIAGSGEPFLGGAGGPGSPPGSSGSPGHDGAPGAMGSPGAMGVVGSNGASTGDRIFGDTTTNATPPIATLNALGVTNNNASSLTPYTFTVTYFDPVLVDVKSVIGADLQVQTPGGTNLTPTVSGVVLSGLQDGQGDAQIITVTYVIAPPGGSWTNQDVFNGIEVNGNYTINLVSNPPVDLGGNPVATGTLGSFSVNVNQVPDAPAISQSPSNHTVLSGNNVLFTASAEGTPSPMVQWEVSADDGPFVAVAGNASAKTPTLSLHNVTASMNGDVYAAIFTNVDGAAVTDLVTLTVISPLSITPATLTPATVGNIFSAQLNATGGSGQGYTFTITGEPSWLTLSSTGLLSGTPSTTTGSPVHFTIKVTDSDGNTTSHAYALTIDPTLLIGPAILPVATVDDNFRTQLTAKGGSGKGYSFSSSDLPSWLSLSSTGLLSGTPTTTSGSPLTFSITLTDSTGATGTQNCTLTVDPALLISPTTLPVATVDDKFSEQLMATGGSGMGYTFKIAGEPSWLTLGGTGLLSGTPPATTGSPLHLMVTVTDSIKATGSATFALTIDPAVTLAPSTLPKATVGNPFSVPLTARGGDGSGYTFTATGLPSWLTLVGGVLAGTPTTTTGSPVHFTISVSDSDGGTTSHAYALTIDPALVIGPNTLPVATVGDKFRAQLTAKGGSGEGYAFSASGLPSWLTLSSTGVLSGTPTTTSGSPISFSITLIDSNGAKGVLNYVLTIDPALLISPTTLPPATVGDKYSEQLTATGGSGTGYAFTATGLPSWLTLSKTGLLSGTPTSTKELRFSFTVTVTDSDKGAGSESFVLMD